MEIKDIVKDWLKNNGYSGLFNESAECACVTGDLMHCLNPCTDCEAGYVFAATGDDGEEGFRVQKTKPQTAEGGDEDC